MDNKADEENSQDDLEKMILALLIPFSAVVGFAFGVAVNSYPAW